MQNTTCIINKDNTCGEDNDLLCIPEEYMTSKPITDDNITIKEVQNFNGLCKKSTEINEGSMKSHIYKIKENENEDCSRILIGFLKESDEPFSDDEKYNIEKEVNIQHKVHKNLGGNYAPGIIKLEEFDYIDEEKGKMYVIILITECAEDNGYTEMNTKEFENILFFQKIYPCVDNTFDKKLYDYLKMSNFLNFIGEVKEGKAMLQEKIKKQKEKSEEQESEEEQDFNKYYLNIDINSETLKDHYNYYNEETLYYYATLFNTKNFKNCLWQWFIRCKNFLNPFFIALHKLHKINVFHHDLKHNNIWYKKDKGYHFKFIDFGISTTYEETYENMKFKNNNFGNNNATFVPLTKEQQAEAEKAEAKKAAAEAEAKKPKEKLNKKLKEENYSFTKKELIMLMIAEIDLPKTLPRGTIKSQFNNIFTFFNILIFGNIIELITDYNTISRNINVKNIKLINKFKKKEKKEIIKNSEIQEKMKNFKKKGEKYTEEITDIFKQFIAERYADAVMEYYKY